MRIKRLLSVGALQGANLLVPLVTVPVVIAKVGIASFGVYAAMLALSMILVAAGDLGVNLQGVKALARANAPEQLLGFTRHFCKLRVCGTLLATAATFGLWLFDVVGTWQQAALLGGISGAQLLAGGWALQGVGGLRVAQVCLLIGRMAFMGFIVIAVDATSTVESLLVWECVAYVAYCAMTWIAFARRAGSPMRVATLRPELSSGKRLSAATLLQTAALQLPSVLLVKLQGGAAAGQFALAARVANIVRRVMLSMSADAMPELAKCLDVRDAIRHFRRVRLFLLGLCGVAVVGIAAAALPGHALLEAHGGAGQTFVVLLILPLCVLWLLGNVYGVLGLVAVANDERTYGMAIVVASVAGIVASWLASLWGSVDSVLWALLAVETVLVLFLKRRFDGFRMGVIA